MKTITLIRHGEVQEDFIGKYNGHNDIALSKNGILQTLTLAKKLSNQHFDIVFCSDLRRTKQTLQVLQLQTNKVVLSKNLREKSWGEDEGKSFEQLTKEGKEYKDFMQWINSLSGESVEDFQKRVIEYFFLTIASSNAKNIAVVTHSGVIKILLKFIKNLNFEEAFSLRLAYNGTIILYFK